MEDDWPLSLFAVGLLGLLWPARKGRWIEALGISLAWIPHIVLFTVIWEGRVSDALLAAKLPVLTLAALGLAIAAGAIVRWWRWLGVGLAVLWLIVGPLAYVPLIAVPLVLVATLFIQLPLARAVDLTQAQASRRHAILVEGLINVKPADGDSA